MYAKFYLPILSIANRTLILFSCFLSSKAFGSRGGKKFRITCHVPCSNIRSMKRARIFGISTTCKKLAHLSIWLYLLRISGFNQKSNLLINFDWCIHTVNMEQMRTKAYIRIRATVSVFVCVVLCVCVGNACEWNHSAIDDNCVKKGEKLVPLDFRNYENVCFTG